MHLTAIATHALMAELASRSYTTIIANVHLGMPAITAKIVSTHEAGFDGFHLKIYDDHIFSGAIYQFHSELKDKYMQMQAKLTT